MICVAWCVARGVVCSGVYVVGVVASGGVVVCCCCVL